MSDAAGVTLAPDPAEWVLPSATWRPSDAQRRFREQLGLPSDQPIVVCGHQAEFFHFGILAKYLAADRAASQHGFGVAWLVVDQDDNDPLTISCPVLDADVLRAQSVSLGASSGAGPTCARPAAKASGEDFPYATEAVARGVRTMRERLEAHADAPNLAKQVASANADLLRALELDAPVLVATRLHETDLFGDWVARMAADPESCRMAYNAALSSHMRPLHAGELPLWRVRGGMRRAVMADDLASIPASELAPRAMMMTGLLRTASCELFVHGLGAGGHDAKGGYERATDAWLKAWLGEAPRGRVVVASATVHLDLPGDAPPREADVAAAKARAHKARHDPSILGDTEAAQEKQRLIDEIAQAKQAGGETSRLFAAMQSLIAEYRDRRASDLARLGHEAKFLRERFGEREVRLSRTWPWPLYDTDQMLELKREIEIAFE